MSYVTRLAFCLSVLALLISGTALMICLLLSKPDTVSQINKQIDENRLLIDSAAKILSMAINKVKEQKELIKENKSLLKHKPRTISSVHKHIKPFEKTFLKSRDYGQHYAMPLDESLTTDLALGVDVTNDSVVIKYTGYYYVYGNVRFSARQSIDQEVVFAFVHVTNPSNSSRSRILLKLTLALPPNSSRIDESRFNGGVFKLVEGELLTFCMTSERLAEFIKQDSFIGMFMLPENNL